MNSPLLVLLLALLFAVYASSSTAAKAHNVDLSDSSQLRMRGRGPRGPRPRPEFTCPNICRRRRRQVIRECRRLKGRCVIMPCEGVGEIIDGTRVRPRGFKCAEPSVTPTPTRTPIPTLDPDDPINVDNVPVGEKITVEVNISIPLGSGTPMEDFYLLSDATGSISTGIATVQAGFMEVINNRLNASSDVAFGVGFYRDEADAGTTNGFVNLQSITTDTTPVLSAISTLTAAGGGDFSEANLAALFQVATDSTIGFRTGARKIIVYFGDAPGHEPTCFDSTVLTRDVVVSALNGRDITVVAASFSGGLDAVPTAFGCPAGSPPVGGAGQGTFITDGTGGTLVDSADQAGLIDSIIEAVGTLDQEISADTSDCDGNVGVTFDPPLPLTLAPGEFVILNETIMIMEGVCDEDPGFSCTVQFIASGGLLGTQTITTTTEIGCP